MTKRKRNNSMMMSMPVSIQAYCLSFLSSQELFCVIPRVSSQFSLALHTRHTWSPTLSFGFTISRSFDICSVIDYRMQIGGLRVLDLSSLPHTVDNSVLNIVGLSHNLYELNLRSCYRITDDGISYLRNGQLRRLVVSSTSVTAKCISYLATIPTLSHLEMVDCGYSYMKTDCFSDLLSLTYLDISGTGIFGKTCIPVTRSSIVHLGLGHCNVSDVEISNLSNMYNLAFLDITSIHITDISLMYLQNIVTLKRLHLSCCKKLTDNGIAYLRSLPSLTYLDLRLCSLITDTGLESLASLPLEHLILSSCAITNMGMVTISKFPLKTLDISYCRLVTDTGIRLLRNVRTLMNLNIRGCRDITDISMSIIGNLRLEQLSISSCRRITDHGLTYLSNRIHTLDISYTSITDQGMLHLSNMIRLRSLHLNYCAHVTDKGLEYLSIVTSPSITHLSICGSINITNSGLRHLKSLPIYHVDISNCEGVTGIGVSILDSIQSIHTVIAKWNTGIEGSDIGMYRNIRSIDISGSKCITISDVHHLLSYIEVII